MVQCCVRCMLAVYIPVIQVHRACCMDNRVFWRPWLCRQLSVVWQPDCNRLLCTMADGAWQAEWRTIMCPPLSLYFKRFEKRQDTEWLCKTVVCSVRTELWLLVAAWWEMVVMVEMVEMVEVCGILCVFIYLTTLSMLWLQDCSFKWHELWIVKCTVFPDVTPCLCASSSRRFERLYQLHILG